MSVYLITGASSGLGLSMARKLCQAKHRVLGVARNAEKLQAVADEFPEYFTALTCDVSNKKAVAKLCAGLDQLPDVVILNAGIGDFDPKEGPSLEQHERVFATNYFGVLYFIDGLFPAFAERGHGKFVAVSSIAAYRGLPGASAYGASKAALSTAIETFRLNYAKLGVEFVLVHPGFVNTPIHKGKGDKLPFVWTTEKAAQYILDGVHTGKVNINFPVPMRVGITLAQLMPAGLYRKLMKG